MNPTLLIITPVLALAALTPSNQPGPGEPPAKGSKLTGVQVSAAARKIDRLLLKDMRRGKISPNANANDATFLRRAYLGILGRIPSSAESRRFLQSQSQKKRAELVDQLLEQPGYNSRMFNYWADLFRVKTRLNNQVSGEPFIHFLKESVASNKPYDEFVREMVTAQGPAHERGNGATGLMMRDRGMPLDSMANTVRVFLGTRLECAQCHNHPFDRWTQKDFYQMAAFAGGLGYRADLSNNPAAKSVRKITAELRGKKDRNELRALNRMVRQVTSGVSGSGTGLAQLPKDYQYEDGKPRMAVQAHAIFGKTPKIEYPAKKDPKNARRGNRGRRLTAKQRRRLEMAKKRRNRGRNKAPQLDTRAAFADWLTAKDNPRFTQVIANRMWRMTMGRGLIEPIDNIMDKTKASNPELMKYLERLMVDCNYDLKAFQRILFRTETFQREATRKEIAADEKYYFQGPMLRRMTAEQVWDSMLGLVISDVDSTLAQSGARAERIYEGYERIVTMSEAELRKEVSSLAERYRNPQKYRAEIQRKQRAAAAKRRADAKAKQNKRNEQRRKAQPIYRALIKARRAKDKAEVARLQRKLKALGIEPKKAAAKRQAAMKQMRNRRNRRGRNGSRLVRASDQQHPAPAGHFLRNFGQSDREQIQASHTEANVPQVLSLLNGFVEKQVLANRDSALMASVKQASGSKAKVREAYLSILSREPRGRELAVWANDLDQLGDAAVRDLVWTLVNTHEFRFIQ